MSFSPSLSRRSRPRGSALLLAVVLVFILGMVGLAVVSRATKDGDSVSAKRHYDQTLSCADAARELLMSQFRAYGVPPTELILDTTVGDKSLESRHYTHPDGGAMQVAVTTVTKAAGAAKANLGATDISNRISRVGLGGEVYRMTVMCSSGSGTAERSSEVEYLVRFGL